MNEREAVTAGRVLHVLDLIRADLAGLRIELAHQRELTERRLDEIEKQIGRHTSELQSRENLVCRLLLEKKKT